MKPVNLPKQLTGDFVYLDCGARGDISNPLLKVFRDSHYIGFDPGLTDLPPGSNKKCTFFPVVIGKQSETLEFHRTKNPSCSSLFIPDLEFLERFAEIGPFFQIEETFLVDVATLDEFLPQNGIEDIDFMELDTQGSELYILQGGEKFLSSSVLGVRVEVELAEMYQNQPMIGDVDRWLRQHGFMLFDFERYHLRRKSCPPGINSREQIVWGQALYLRNYRSFSGDPTTMKQKLSKLTMVASYYGFHSYAFEIIDYLTQEAELLTTAEKVELERSSTQYVSELENNRISVWMQSLDKSAFHETFRRLGGTLIKFYEAYQFVTRRQKYFWKD